MLEVRRPRSLVRRALAALVLLLLCAACGKGTAEPQVQIVLVGDAATPVATGAAAASSVVATPAITAGGTYRLAATADVATALSPVLQQITARTPGLNLTLSTYPGAAAAQSSGADLVLRTRLPGEPAVAGEAVVSRTPLALVLPLTTPPDDLTLSQAVGLITGSITDMHQVGGNPGPVRLALARPDLLADVGGLVGRPDLKPAAVRTDDAATLIGEVDTGANELVVAPWTALRLHSKALRIDGHLPDDDGYALATQLTEAPLHPEAQGIAAQLAGALSAGLKAPRDGTVTIDAMGDLMLARGVAALAQRHGPDWALASVAGRLQGSDLRFANLELALTDRGVQAHKDYTFRAPPSAAQGLGDVHLTVADLANNHILDYGPQGLLDTIAALDSAGVIPIGAGADQDQAHRPVILTVNGLRIAWLAYVNVPDDSVTGFVARSLEAGPGKPGVAWGTPDIVRRDVEAARQNADLVVVALHSGFEYTSDPNTVQRDLAHAAIDAGAALVLGAHPHVLQGIEFYHGGVIAYSLGNFVFDLDDADRVHYGLPSVLTVVLRVQLDGHGVTGLEVYPAIINSVDFRPEPVVGDAARPVYDRLEKLTDALNPH